MIKKFLKRFFKNVEQTNCEPTKEEMINGQAFHYKTHRFLSGEHHLLPTNSITARIDLADGTHEEYTETFNQALVVDSVAIFRTKEAFGMTNVIGAAFGKSK